MRALTVSFRWTPLVRAAILAVGAGSKPSSSPSGGPSAETGTLGANAANDTDRAAPMQHPLAGSDEVPVVRIVESFPRGREEARRLLEDSVLEGRRVIIDARSVTAASPSFVDELVKTAISRKEGVIIYRPPARTAQLIHRASHARKAETKIVLFEHQDEIDEAALREPSPR